MSEREEFLRALAANEDDSTLRLIFADWLDEQGEHEEADRQRRWPAAKAWIVRLCRENNPSPGADTEERPVTYDRLIAMGREAIEEILLSGRTRLPQESLMQMLECGWEVLLRAQLVAAAETWEFDFFCGNNMDMTEALARNVHEFWKNWSIVTGIPLPPGIEEKSRFGCSC
jgi:uncharacterized protein (TIGR02996 family)